MARNQNRRDRYEEEDDSRFDEQKRKNSVLAVIGGSVACIVLAIGTVMVVQSSRKANQEESKTLIGKETTQIKKRFTRDEWKVLLIGKTPEEVVATIGRPDSSDDYTDGSPAKWYFWDTVLNPSTAKHDTGKITFREGKVVDCSWF